MKWINYIALMPCFAMGGLEGSALARKEEAIPVGELEIQIEKGDGRSRKITYQKSFCSLYNHKIEAELDIQRRGDDSAYLFEDWFTRSESELLSQFLNNRVSIGAIEVDGVVIDDYISPKYESFHAYVEETLRRTYEQNGKMSRLENIDIGEVIETKEFLTYKLLQLKTRYYLLYAHCFADQFRQLFPGNTPYEWEDVLTRRVNNILGNPSYRWPSALSKVIQTFMLGGEIVIGDTEIDLQNMVALDHHSSGDQFFVKESERIKQLLGLSTDPTGREGLYLAYLAQCTINYKSMPFRRYDAIHLRHMQVQKSTFRCFLPADETSIPLALQLEHAMVQNCTISVQYTGDEGGEELNSLIPLVSREDEVGQSTFFIGMRCTLPDLSLLKEFPQFTSFKLPIWIDYHDSYAVDKNHSTLYVFYPKKFFQLAGNPIIEEIRLLPQVKNEEDAWSYEELNIGPIGRLVDGSTIDLNNQHIKRSKFPRLDIFKGSFTLSECHISKIDGKLLDPGILVFVQKVDGKAPLYWACTQDRLFTLSSCIKENEKIRLLFFKYSRKLPQHQILKEVDPDYFTSQEREDREALISILKQGGFENEEITRVMEGVRQEGAGDSVVFKEKKEILRASIFEEKSSYIVLIDMASFNSLLGTSFFYMNEKHTIILSHLIFFFRSPSFFNVFNSTMQDEKVIIEDCIFYIGDRCRYRSDRHSDPDKYILKLPGAIIRNTIFMVAEDGLPIHCPDGMLDHIVIHSRTQNKEGGGPKYQLRPFHQDARLKGAYITDLESSSDLADLARKGALIVGGVERASAPERGSTIEKASPKLRVSAHFFSEEFRMVKDEILRKHPQHRIAMSSLLAQLQGRVDEEDEKSIPYDEDDRVTDLFSRGIYTDLEITLEPGDFSTIIFSDLYISNSDFIHVDTISLLAFRDHFVLKGCHLDWGPLVDVNNLIMMIGECASLYIFQYAEKWYYCDEYGLDFLLTHKGVSLEEIKDIVVITKHMNHDDTPQYWLPLIIRKANSLRHRLQRELTLSIGSRHQGQAHSMLFFEDAICAADDLEDIVDLAGLPRDLDQLDEVKKDAIIAHPVFSMVISRTGSPADQIASIADALNLLSTPAVVEPAQEEEGRLIDSSKNYDWLKVVLVLIPILIILYKLGAFSYFNLLSEAADDEEEEEEKRVDDSNLDDTDL